MALFLVSIGFIFLFWAYISFIDFSKSTWLIYLNYSRYTSINLIVCISFLIEKTTYLEKPITSVIFLLVKSISFLSFYWIIFYKSNFLGKIQNAISDSMPLYSTSLISYNILSELDIYHMITGGLGIVTILMPVVFFIGSFSIIYTSMSKKKLTLAEIKN